MTGETRIVLAADHGLAREGMSFLFSKNEGMTVVAEAGERVHSGDFVLHDLPRKNWPSHQDHRNRNSRFRISRPADRPFRGDVCLHRRRAALLRQRWPDTGCRRCR